jgi:hypothetical protein
MRSVLKVLLCSLFLMLLLGGTTTFSEASPQIITKLDPTEGTLNSSFIFEVRIIVNDKSSIREPVFKENKFFTVKPYATSMQQHIVNRELRIQRIYSYKIIPRPGIPAGKYMTPYADVMVGSEKYKIPPETVLLQEASAQHSNRLFEGSKGARIPRNMNEFSFVQLVSNDNPFIGEQVSYRLELITPANLKEAKLQDFNPEGLWRERLQNDGKSSRIVQNVTIHSFSESWFPIRSGTLEIPPRELLAHLILKNRSQQRSLYERSFSEQFFGGLFPLLNDQKIIERTITSNPLKLNVRPLPPPPSANTGYVPVGTTRVTSSIDKNTASTGDSITLTIQITSKGNLKPYTLPAPDNKTQNNFRIYKDKPIYSKTEHKGEVIYYKTFRISLVPQLSGELSIPEYTIHWFDPKSEEYKSTTTQAGRITVTGDSISEPEEMSDRGEKTPQKTEEDKTIRLENLYNKRITEIPPYLIYLAGILGVLSIFLYLTLFYMRKHAQGNLKKRTIKHTQNEILNEVKGHASFPLTHAESFLKDFIQASMEIPAHSYTAEEIRHALTSSGGFSSDEISTLHSFLLDSENERYSGAGTKSLPGEELLSMIKIIEKHT